MQQRRGTAEQWTTADPVLAPGEIGFETDTGQFKVGDGVNIWSELSYFVNENNIDATLEDYVPLSLLGMEDGVATLDETGNVPESQLGNVPGVDLSGKQDTITGAATTITSDNLTASRAVVSDSSGKVGISAVTSTELGHVSGVTSAIQSQLNGKSPLAGSTSITTVGTVTNATSPTGNNSKGLRNITVSDALPSGGADGDIWMRP
jgi:hypothetical protein